MSNRLLLYSSNNLRAYKKECFNLKNVTEAARTYGWKCLVTVTDRTWQEVIEARIPALENTEKRLSLVLYLAAKAVKEARDRRFIQFRVPPSPVRLEGYQLFVGQKNKSVIIAQMVEAEELEGVIT